MITCFFPRTRIAVIRPHKMCKMFMLFASLGLNRIEAANIVL